MDNTGKIFVSVWLSSSVLLGQFLQNIHHFQMENATKELDLVRHFKNSLLMTGNLIDRAQEMENLMCYSDLRGRKTSIGKTVKCSLSLSGEVHLENFAENNSDYSTVPSAQAVFVSQHDSPFKS